MAQLSIRNFSNMVCNRMAFAEATIKGNDQYPNIIGAVSFYNARPGVLVTAEVFNLPSINRQDINKQYGSFYGFHLHEGNSCGSGAGDNPFEASGGHYNPTGSAHPYHAGDFPPLLSDNNGYAYISFYTNRLTPADVIGKTVIVHQHADDFHSQPSGDSGMKLACGIVYSGIEPARERQER